MSHKNQWVAGMADEVCLCMKYEVGAHAGGTVAAPTNNPSLHSLASHAHFFYYGQWKEWVWGS